MESCQYNLFKTRRGWFGLVGCRRGLVRTYLPESGKSAVLDRIRTDYPNAQRSNNAFSTLKTRILSYYEGKPGDFRDIEVCLGGFSEFQRKTLAALRTVTYGNSVSYKQLAKMSGNPNAARAIGSVMAQNPLPLIIPCHRVIKADGTPGQFSAAGGTDTKIRMLELERRPI